MKVLLLHDELYPNTSANARIVYRIVDELLKHVDVDITILGCARTKEQFEPFYHRAKIIHKPWRIASRYLHLVRCLGRFKWLRYILMPRSFIYRLKYQHWEPRDVEMFRWIYYNRSRFDVILACGMPFYTIDIASKLAKYIPVVNYYMEPFWNDLLKKDTEKIDIFKLWDGSASRIITTESISKLYKINSKKDIMDKIILAEFPNVFERQAKNLCVKKIDTINLVFVGKFYPNVRNPQYLFDIMEHIHLNGISLTMAGGFNGSFSESFVERYFQNKASYIKYLGMLPAQDADKLLLQSDILIHIGNTDPNLLPSKILDYISTGKPIINLYQNEQCPTLEILEQYPLKLNIRTETPITQELVRRIVDFCKDNLGKKLPFTEIEPLYKKYTPKVVGEIFYKTLKDAFESKRKIKL